MSCWKWKLYLKRYQCCFLDNPPSLSREGDRGWVREVCKSTREGEGQGVGKRKTH